MLRNDTLSVGLEKKHQFIGEQKGLTLKKEGIDVIIIRFVNVNKPYWSSYHMNLGRNRTQLSPSME